MRTGRLGLFLVLLASTGAGCSSMDDAQPSPALTEGEEAPTIDSGKPPVILDFRVSAERLSMGAVVDLVYSIADAETITITTETGITVLATTTQLSGQAASRPLMANTTFVLRARNGIREAERSLVVTVGATDAPKHAALTSFTAAPPEVMAGGQTALSWITSDAASGQIRRGDTIVHTIPPADLASGLFQVSPTETTAYLLAVMGTDNQEITRTRLVTVTSGGPAQTARQVFDQTVAPILHAKCTSCHAGAMPDKNGPNFLGTIRSDAYAALKSDPRLVTPIPENSLLLQKGQHAGPALCTQASSTAQGTLNTGCTPTIEEQSVTHWLLKEGAESGNTPNPSPPTPGDFTPRTLTEALTRFGACMSLADWNATYAQSDQTEIARQNTTEGRCYSCHASGAGGAFLSINTDDTLAQNKLRPFVLKLVAPSAPNPDGTFNPALLPAYRFRDKGNDPCAVEASCHPAYILTDARNQAIDEFVNRTLTKYSTFSQQCTP